MADHPVRWAARGLRRVRAFPRLPRSLSTLFALSAVLLAGGQAQAQTVITRWDFNYNPSSPPSASNPPPSIGTGTAVALNVTPSFAPFTGGGSDPGTTFPNPPPDGTFVQDAWFTANYPAQGTFSGQAGVEFRTSTVGRQNIIVTFDVNSSAPASRWFQVQYSTDGGANYSNFGGPIDRFQSSGSAGSPVNWNSLNFGGVAGAANNPDFRVRIVSVFAPGTSQYEAFSGTYNSSSIIRVNYDYVTFSEAKRWTGTGGSIQTGSNWNDGQAPVSADVSSNLAFGSVGGSPSVSVSNDIATRFQSITFAAGSTTSYTLTGQTLFVGPGGGVQLGGYGGLTTLVNASGLQQRIDAPIHASNRQIWDTGSAAGGSFVINGAVAITPISDGASSLGLTITGANPITINGAVTGSGAITKTGTGTLTLSNGANTFQDTTTSNSVTINQGAVRVTNTSGSATGIGGVVVNSSGILTGSGTVAPTGSQTVTVNSGGVIRGGDTLANRTLTVGGSNGLTVAAGGIVRPRLFGTGASTTDFGLVNVNGSASVTNAVLELDLNGKTAGDMRAAVGFGNSRTYTIVSATGASSYTFASNNFTALGFAPGEWTIGTSGNNAQLTFTPVPEPALLLPVAAGALALVGRVRRRLIPAA
jgi:hypothetical protein